MLLLFREILVTEADAVVTGFFLGSKSARSNYAGDFIPLRGAPQL